MDLSVDVPVDVPVDLPVDVPVSLLRANPRTRPDAPVLVLVIPIFNDWVSVMALLQAIDQRPELSDTSFHVILVNDGSPLPDRWHLGQVGRGCIGRVELLDLVANVGHQRAIAIGLVVAARVADVTGVVVMDGDGEDRPQDIAVLLHQAAARPGHIICARRSERSESRLFRTFYGVYKLAFRCLTGRTIDFGNFCFIPVRLLNAVNHNPATWNHLAASILRSRIPVAGVDAPRGRRLAGELKMNFTTLILHGMSAISVYADLVMVRIVLAMIWIAGLTVLAMVSVVVLRLTTSIGIPGWASNMLGSLAVMLLESLLFATIAVFMLLNARSTRPVIPAFDVLQMVAAHSVVWSAEAAADTR